MREPPHGPGQRRSELAERIDVTKLARRIGIEHPLVPDGEEIIEKDELAPRSVVQCVLPEPDRVVDHYCRVDALDQVVEIGSQAP